jgi:hypothetical protein
LPERTYIDDIVDALFKGENHRKYVLKEVQRRVTIQVSNLINRILREKDEKNTDWWKNKLILAGTNKNEIAWFGGLNIKTIHNMAGTTSIEICKSLSAENYDALKSLIKELPREFPKFKIVFTIKGKKYELSEVESFIFTFVVSSMSKALSGGAWSEVGKRAGTLYLQRLFEKLGIGAGPLAGDLYYQLEVLEKERAIDSTIYYKGKQIMRIEIKLLGPGNPEIGDEAIARKPDIFLVDKLTDMMKRQAEQNNITVIEIRNAPMELYEKLKEKNLPVKKPI